MSALLGGYCLQDCFTWKTIGEFLVFKAPLETATAEFDDHVDIVGGDVAASDIAEVVIFSIKRADRTGCHVYLRAKQHWLGGAQGKKPAKPVVTGLPWLNPLQQGVPYGVKASPVPNNENVAQ